MYLRAPLVHTALDQPILVANIIITSFAIIVTIVNRISIIYCCLTHPLPPKLQAVPCNEMSLGEAHSQDAFLLFQMRSQDIDTLASFLMIFTGIFFKCVQVVRIEVFQNMELVSSMQLKLADLPSTHGPLPTNFCRYPAFFFKDFAVLPQGLVGLWLHVGSSCVNFSWRNSVTGLTSVKLHF